MAVKELTWPQCSIQKCRRSNIEIRFYIHVCYNEFGGLWCLTVKPVVPWSPTLRRKNIVFKHLLIHQITITNIKLIDWLIVLYITVGKLRFLFVFFYIKCILFCHLFLLFPIFIYFCLFLSLFLTTNFEKEKYCFQTFVDSSNHYNKH
jgi:hypothetical protein